MPLAQLSPTGRFSFLTGWLLFPGAESRKNNAVDLTDRIPLVFEQIPLGGDRNFGYLIGDRSHQAAVLVDPSYDPAKLVERARAQSLRVVYILNTHGHPDHINGNDEAKRLTGASIAVFREALHRFDLPLEDNGVLRLGDLVLRCLHTPGHSPDHLVIFVEHHAIAVTGDLLFVGKVGGTSQAEEAATEWNSLQRILSELPPHTTVWPGHDYGSRPASTLALERHSNPFLCCRDLAEFLQLKEDWALFKAEKGLR